MFSKILIANRGEIACRIIRTARRMGIQTVAVYSEADADALHVRLADEAVQIGPAASSQSYLVIDRILDACRRTGAEAVHPGYGFLSEREAFAKALKEAGITFIGPSPSAIAAMGDKIESKILANSAGVRTVPGFLGDISDEAEAVRIAREIGFPVMVKASAGGGGKGMRLAHNEAELREGLVSARSEARSSFGDERVFIEKYIEQPRHIEIQILADTHGTVLHLGERECSIQRRHQKVIEEAPSPFLDESTRKAMGEQAVALARAVGYSSAGTVEFIVAPDRSFYFLEMNTRLQVEHPVTEHVTGLDLVEWMIRIAAGERLPFTQDNIRLKGWSVEARIYAEDPYRGFLPSTGRLTRFHPPREDTHVRVDTGVYEGAEISMHYDPMIAKLITTGDDRKTALGHMLQALNRFELRGVAHNIPFLSALFSHPRFVAGRLSTNFIAEEFPGSFTGAVAEPDTINRLFGIVAWAHALCSIRQRGTEVRDWVIRVGTESCPVSVANSGAVEVCGTTYEIQSGWQPHETLWEGAVGGEPMTVQIERKGHRYQLWHSGLHLQLQVLSARAAVLLDRMPIKTAPDMSRYLLSPMPGLLSVLHVQEGDEVRAGQALAVIEAMKMENVLRAERDGKIAKVHARAGRTVSADEPILEFA